MQIFQKIVISGEWRVLNEELKISEIGVSGNG